MAETTPKIQIAISVLLLVIAVASFVFGPGIIFRYTAGNSQASAVATQTPVSAVPKNDISQMANSTNSIERNQILGRWANDPSRDDPDVLENWTFYEDGTFSEIHNTHEKAEPPSFDHGTWNYLGNNKYVITLDAEKIDVIGNSSVLLNVEDQCTFHRIV